MNKAITDGLVLMPPAFENGLGVWSSGDGTSGSPTYLGASNAAIASADADFGNCLELLKTDAVQKLRYMGQTPMQPGCYLRIRARVKAVSGNLPDVRVAAWAGDASDAHVSGLVEVGSTVTLTNYGRVVEVSAIVGSGSRGGVDMVWGTPPIYGHFGIDLLGANGGVVRIDDIIIEDISSAFLRDLVNVVDVRDYGAIGDGIFDNAIAFEAADTAALGRTVLIPDGVYHLGDHVTFENPAHFRGTVTMPADKRLSLTKNFKLPDYISAFGNEQEALKKALQALYNYTDHESLDLGGRQVAIDGPIDVHAVVGNQNSFASRRVIRNGELTATASSNWDDVIVTSQATYVIANKLQLTGVQNVANVPIGARISGSGVGREVYVRDVDVGAQTITLSQPLFGAVGTQTYTFTRHRYMLDFSGFSYLARLVLDDVDINCDGHCSALMLPTTGRIAHIRDCFITKPKDKGITSIGSGCQGMMVDRCHFLTNEHHLRAQDRVSIGINVNANDVKIRDNRSNRFAHFAVLFGSGHLISGNHWFQGDDEPAGIRQPGLIFTNSNVKSTVIGNYIDNSFIEWNNEHDAEPDFGVESSFGGLSITGNIFTANDVASWFNWIVVKPYGAGHFVDGMSVSENVFRVINGRIDRVDFVDTSYASLDFGRMRKISWEGNTYTSVDAKTTNPIMVKHDEASDMQTWQIDLAAYLPFQAWARRVESVVAEGIVTNASGSRVTDMPYVTVQTGAQQTAVDVVWEQACKGRVWVTARMDNPT